MVTKTENMFLMAVPKTRSAESKKKIKKKIKEIENKQFESELKE